MRVSPILPDRVASWSLYFGGADERLGHAAGEAIAPFVGQFAITDSDWFNGQHWPYLQRWLERWLNSDLYARIIQKYPQWSSGDAGVTFPEPL
jgi:hypothetical protein